MTTTSPKTIPLLENGDRLTRHEFEQRYAAMPYQKTGLWLDVEAMLSGSMADVLAILQSGLK